MQRLKIGHNRQGFVLIRVACDASFTAIVMCKRRQSRARAMSAAVVGLTYIVGGAVTEETIQ